MAEITQLYRISDSGSLDRREDIDPISQSDAINYSSDPDKSLTEVIEAKADLTSGQVVPLQLRWAFAGGLAIRDYHLIGNDEALKRPDRHLEALFTTGEDITTAQYVARQYGPGSFFAIAITNSAIQVNLSGAFARYPCQPKTSYHVWVGGSGDIFVNGAHFATLIPTMEVCYDTPLGVGATERGTYNFTGEIHMVRLLAPVEGFDPHPVLWNEGKLLYRSLSTAPGNPYGAIAEYLPWSVAAGAWYDLSPGGAHLTASADPAPALLPLPDLSGFEVRTGVFVTDIAQGTAAKRLIIPLGYYVDRVIIRNHNATALTGVRVKMLSDNLCLINSGTVQAQGIHVSDGMLSAQDGTPRYYGVSYTTGSANYMDVNASGNGSEGMEVIVKCKWMSIL